MAKETKWVDIDLNAKTLRRLRAKGYVKTERVITLSDKGQQFFDNALPPLPYLLYTVAYTTEAGSSASDVVAARSLDEVVEAYPKWDTIQRDAVPVKVL